MTSIVTARIPASKSRACGLTVVIHLLHVGVSGSPAFISFHPGPSCFSACKKYRPSVQHLASLVVTTASPAEPVKPVMNSLLASHGARYSEESAPCQLCGIATPPWIQMFPVIVQQDSRASSEGMTLSLSVVILDQRPDSRGSLCVKSMVNHELSE
jgi:hypothetical protein